ncbi:MAG: Na+/H+ antiporter subunit E [Lachnospiraceae bacterium]|nr:Na+/H+ antiporter subunit E [Lachnospiraceae bacterium]
MYIVFLLLWILLNGQFTWEIFFFGIVIAGAMYAFICKFLDYSIETDILIVRKLPYILLYILVLIWEIIKANVGAIQLALSYRREIDPVIVKFKTDLKTDVAKVVLANSITLTPGTITVAMEDDELIVHALDVDLVKGIDDSVFVHMLRKMEAMDREVKKKRRKSHE